MGRKRRLWNPNIFDHVVMRGNNRQNIFKTDADTEAFLRILRHAHQKYRFTLIAYCLMTNHYHLLIRSPEVPLGKVMAHINKRYSDYHKKKYNYFGALYESRYHADRVLGNQNLLRVSRYIHRNPISTITPMVEEMESYPYSSYFFYIDEKPSPYEFLELNHLIPLLQAPYRQTAKDYRLYCEREEEANCAGIVCVPGTETMGK